MNSEQPWVHILTSTRPQKVRTCPLTGLVRLEHVARDVRHLSPSRSVAQEGVLFIPILYLLHI